MPNKDCILVVDDNPESLRFLVDTLDAQDFGIALDMRDDRMAFEFAEQGAEPRGWSTEQTGRFIQAESDKWNNVIKSANVTLE